jgi:hypothetical protein
MGRTSFVFGKSEPRVQSGRRPTALIFVSYLHTAVEWLKPIPKRLCQSLVVKYLPKPAGKRQVVRYHRTGVFLH